MATATDHPLIPYPILGLASSSSHILLASSSSLYLIDPSLPASSSTSTPTPSLIRYLAVSQDGKFAVTASDDKSLIVWDIAENLTIRSVRKTVKKVACLSFASDSNIIFTDKTGDVFRYPLDPRPVGGEPLQAFVLQTDPTQNPEADLLLGHVSVITSHLCTPDGKSLITADRDEHIRISKYPKSYIIERFLFIPDGFTSAIHIPSSYPNIILSAGGEPLLNIWDWNSGVLLGSVDIWPSILPHRRVRTPPRKQKRKRPSNTKAPSDDPNDEGWYAPPEGFIMPHGQGICVQKIDSVLLGGETVIVFYSQGAAALHAFTLNSPTDPGEIHTLPVSHPVLGMTPIPSKPDHFLVSLDTAWGILKANIINYQKPNIPELTEDQIHTLSQQLITIQIGPGGVISLIDDSLSSHLNEMVKKEATPMAVATTNLYSDLGLFPRWLGFEDDEEDNTPVSVPSTPTRDPDEEGEGVEGEKKAPTAEEMGKMGIRALGRLKSQGVNVGGHLLSRKKRRLLAQQARATAAKAGGEGGELREESEEVGENVEESELDKSGVETGTV